MSNNGVSANKAWIVCGLLLLATMINYMDRLTLNQTISRIMVDFDFQKDFYGKIEGVFGLAFAVGAITTGLIVDKVSVKFLYPLMVFFWSLSGFMTGLARDKEELLYCRAALGFFEAANWPCALVTTQRLLAPSKRTMGNSILQSGAALGAVITPIIVELCLHSQLPGTLAHLAGWRITFLIVGLIGLLWILLWSVVTKDISLNASDESFSSENSKSSFQAMYEILSDRRFWVLQLMVLAINSTWHFLRAWLPLYLREAHGYTESQVNWFSSGYYLASDAGALTAGFLTLLLVSKGASVINSRKWVYGFFSFFTLLSIPAAFMPSGPLFLVVLIMIGFSTLALFPSYYSFSQDLTVKHQGKITGALGSLNWVGMFVMQISAGYLIQRTENNYFASFISDGFAIEEARKLAQGQAYTWGIIIAGIPPILALIALHLFWYEKNKSPQTPAAT